MTSNVQRALFLLAPFLANSLLSKAFRATF
jgi:hypothetical protein